MPTENVEIAFRFVESGTAQIDRAIASIREYEKSTEGTGRAADQAAKSTERYITSLERSAVMAGKSREQQIELQRVFALIDKGDSAAAIGRINTAFDKLANAARTEDVSKYLKSFAKDAAQAERDAQKMGASILAGIQSPSMAAASALENLAVSLGPVGIAAGAVALGLGIAGGAALKLAADAGALAEQQSNIAVRTGLSVKEVGLFSAVAEDAGVSGQGFVTAMKTLSQALSDNTDEGKKAKRALADLGIETSNAFGAQKRSAELWLEISDSLGKIEDPAARARLAIETLGRSGLDLLPALQNGFRDTLEEYRKFGVGFDDESAKTVKNLDDALDRMLRKWKTALKDLGVGVAGALGFEDPAKSTADAAKRAADQRERFARYDRVRRGADPLMDIDLPEVLANWAASDRRLAIAPATTVKDLQAQQEVSTRTKILGLLQSQLTLQDKLREAEADVAESRRKNDLGGVERGLKTESSLRSQIEAQKREKTDLLDRLLTEYGKRDVSKIEQLSLTLGQQERDLRKAGYGSDAVAKLYRAAGPDRAKLLNDLPLFRTESRLDPNSDALGFALPGGDRTSRVSAALAAMGDFNTGSFMAGEPGNDKSKAEQDKAFADGLLASLKAQEEIRQRTNTSSVEAGIRLLEIAGKEYEAAAVLRDLKLSTAKNSADARQADFDYAVRIMEIDKQRLDQYKAEAGKVYDVLRQSGGGGLGDLFRGQFEILQKQLFVNGSGKLFQSAGGMLGKIGAASGLPSDLLEGTLFDPKNASGPVQKNTTSLGLIHIRKGKTRAAARTLRLTEEARQIIGRRLGTLGPWVFPNPRDTDTHLLKLNKAHDLICEKAGLPIVLYDFRHTFATRLAEAGVDAFAIAAILGHASTRVLSRYIHPTQQHQDAAMEIYDRVYGAGRLGNEQVN